MEEVIYKRQVLKLAIAKRVVDDEQTDRHYAAFDVNQLYSLKNIEGNFEPPLGIHPTLSDDVLRNLITNNSDCIVKYENHDGLLENIEGEELSKDDINIAWKEYEHEMDTAQSDALKKLSSKYKIFVSKTLQLF